MITSKNISHEDIEILTVYDESVPGFRVVAGDMLSMVLKPGEQQVQLGYEPGVSHLVRPVKKQEIPRMRLEHGGFVDFMERGK